MEDAIEIVYHGDSGKFPLTVVGACPSRDLAICERKDASTEINGLEFTDSLSVNLGDEVYALGYPSGEHTLKITRGIISGFTSIMGPTFIQTTADLNHGNSGGPLICNGKVIGITTGAREEMNGIGYAIPSRVFLTLQHLMIGTINAPNLDLEFRGNTIIGVPPESEFKSILKVGDVLRHISCSDFTFSNHILETPHGRRRTSFREISEILPLCSPMEVSIERKRVVHNITVTLNCNVQTYESEPQDYVILAGMIIANVTDKMDSGTIGDIIVTYVFLEMTQIFEPGDQIVSVNGVNVHSIDDIRRAVDLSENLTINGFELGDARELALMTSRLQRRYGIVTSHLTPQMLPRP